MLRLATSVLAKTAKKTEQSSSTCLRRAFKNYEKFRYAQNNLQTLKLTEKEVTRKLKLEWKEFDKKQKFQFTDQEIGNSTKNSNLKSTEKVNKTVIAKKNSKPKKVKNEKKSVKEKISQPEKIELKRKVKIASQESTNFNQLDTEEPGFKLYRAEFKKEDPSSTDEQIRESWRYLK